MFTGDSITDLRRPVDEDRSGCGYPLRIAGDWCFRHPDRPVTWLNTANAGDKVMDLETRWQTDVLDARLLAADGMFAELAATTGPEYWSEDGVHPTPAGHAALAAAWLRLVA